jgi:large subunit ribosomal protein L9
MKVILKEYVYKHGVAGDVVDVANGFARNFLIPKGLAEKATKDALNRNGNLLAQAAMRRQELNEQLVQVSDQIEGTELVFGRKAGSNGKLYGSVTTMDLAEALLEKTGIDINRRRISDRSLRELGTFDVTVRMGGDLSPSIKVTIVREEDLAAYLAGDVEVEEILAEVSEAYTDNVEVAEVGEALLDEEEVVGALEESEDAAEGLEESEEPEEPEEE